MNIESKIELLKYILLESPIDYDLMLYNLISRKDMYNIVALIDDKTFSFKVNASSGCVSSKQLLVNLNQFIKDMKSYFYNITHLQSCIEEVINSNINDVKELVCYKCDSLLRHFEKEKDEDIEEIINKLIIKNFISNAKYVDAIKDVLESLEIQIKPVSEYNLDESRKILTLLSDISFCQRGRGPVMALFINIDSKLERYGEMETIRTKKSFNQFKEKIINSCIDDYTKMIKSYYSKKRYLKYFI